MLPHGGPWGRDQWGYNPLAQFFANRGYAVLHAQLPRLDRIRQEVSGRRQPGVGPQDAGRCDLGREVPDRARHRRSQTRWALSALRMAATPRLAGVAFTPDLYAAAVDIVGPSNLITLLDSIPPYWESVRKMFYQRMGDPNTPEGKALLMEESPLNSADKIKTPLLVAQGANDPRVNRREAEQIVIALRDRGFPVEYILAPDEGHGFARPINNLALFMASEKFFAQHSGRKVSGGRYDRGGCAPEGNYRGPEDGRPREEDRCRKHQRSQAGHGFAGGHLQLSGEDRDRRPAGEYEALHNRPGRRWLLDRNRSDGNATRRCDRHGDAGERRVCSC